MGADSLFAAHLRLLVSYLAGGKPGGKQSL